MLVTCVKNFTDFDAFERAREFARALKIPLQKGTFSKDPTLVYQMRKSILSIYSNFTEGFERDGNREFAQYVSISKGSVGEIRGQLLYAVDFDYLPQTEFDKLGSVCRASNSVSRWTSPSPEQQRPPRQKVQASRDRKFFTDRKNLSPAA